MQAANLLILVASGAHLEPRTYGPAANTALEVDRDQSGSSTDGEGSVAAARLPPDLPPKFHFAKIRRFLVNWPRRFILASDGTNNPITARNVFQDRCLRPLGHPSSNARTPFEIRPEPDRMAVGKCSAAWSNGSDPVRAPGARIPWS